MSDKLDLSKDNLKETSDKYGSLLCDDCRNKLKFRCMPIMNKLNKGFPPLPREMIRLMNALCRDCRIKVMAKKEEK